MHQDLKVDGLSTVISNNDAGAQRLGSQGDAVDNGEGVRPLALDTVLEGVGGEAEVELDGGIGWAG